MVRAAHPELGRGRNTFGWAWLIAASLCLALWSRPARADSGAAAEALFAAGRELARRGDAQGACAKFRESYRLDPAQGTELNLAICEAELGHLAAAWELFRSLRSGLPPNDPRVPLVDRHLSELEPRVPRITVNARGPMPAGLIVRTGAVELSESGFGVPIPVDPGEHEVLAEAPGRESRSYRISVGEGELYRLELEPLSPLPSPAPALPAKPSEAKRRSKTARTSAILTFGVAGAALTTALATGLAALDRKRTMDVECDPGGNNCSDAGMQAAHSGSTLATVSTVSVVTSLALAATGAVILVLDSKAHAREQASLTPSRLSLALSPGGVALCAQTP